MTIGRADILAAIRRATPETPPTEHEPCCACCSEVDRHPTVDDVGDFFYAGGVEYDGRGDVDRHVLSDPDVVAAMGMDRLAAAEAVCEAAVVIRDGSHLIHDTDYNTDPLWQALYVWQEARR